MLTNADTNPGHSLSVLRRKRGRTRSRRRRRKTVVTAAEATDESTVVIRFWILGVLFAMVAFSTLKIR